MKQKHCLYAVVAALFLMLLAGCTLLPEPAGTTPGTTAATTVPTTVPPTAPTVTLLPVGVLNAQLLGEPSMTLEYGEAYTDPGLWITCGGREVKADVTVEQPEVGKPGLYTLRYNVAYQGQTVQLSRTVTVVDTQPPVLTLISDPNRVTEMGEAYAEEGYTALDSCDGDLTAQVQWYQEGDTLYYTVSDSSGNTATAQRKLTYVDTKPPVLTLLGEQNVTIMAGETFQDPGCTAMDAGSGDVTDSIAVTGSYDPYQPGSYTITYTARDAYGNVAALSRMVTVQGHVQPETVYPDGKVIYLTFDDGPGKHTPRLLKILEKYNVKATFFVVGSGRLEYLDDIVDGGHAIAIHSDTHEYSKIYASEKAFFKDFDAIREKIHRYTGVWTTLSRFPGGSSNRVSMEYCTGIMTRLTRAVEARGFQYFDWNVDSNDAGGAKTARKVYENVISGIRADRPNIVLQHDIHGYSVDAVEKIIQWGLANGYTFLPLEETSPKAHHSVRN